MERLFDGTRMRTVSGLYIDVFNPDPADIDIMDIAIGLSHCCRWGGQLRQHYSVAQHSVICSHLLEDYDEEMRLAGLMHDAAEAYMCDLPYPIKAMLPEYKAVENGLLKAIAKKFGFGFPLPAPVKQADTVMLHVEWDTIVLKADEYDWSRLWTCGRAADEFLIEFNKLVK
jgi:hypothetical protein